MTNEERKEHLAFLERVVANARANVMQLLAPTHLAAADHEIKGLERAIVAREEFRLWGQADMPFNAAEPYTLRVIAGYVHQEFRSRLESTADRVEAMLALQPPENVTYSSSATEKEV